MIGIVIVTFNNQTTIKKCLKTIFESRFSNKKIFLNLKLVIIDNASQDKTLHKINTFIIEKKIPSGKISLLIKNQNLGFAKGTNLGIKHLLRNKKIKTIFIFNPDAFLEKNCLEKLYQVLRKNIQIGAVSPLILLKKNNKIWFSKGKISWIRLKTFHQQTFEKKDFLSTFFFSIFGKRKNSYLSGCAALIKREVFEKIGFFDERFFLYYEDADFFLRLQKAGWNIKIIKNALCYHQESHSFKKQKFQNNFDKKTYYLVKSGLHFFKKHTLFIFQPYFWIIFWLRFFYHFLFSRKKEVLKALLDFKKEC